MLVSKTLIELKELTLKKGDLGKITYCIEIYVIEHYLALKVL